MSIHKTARRHFIKTGLSVSGVALGIGVNARTTAAETLASPRNEFDVMAFGAKGDGTTLETEAINRAMEAAAAAGGGTVLFPAGNYLSYSIHLRSNVHPYHGSGATIIAADSPATKSNQAYDPAEPNSWHKYQDFGHSHWHNSLIWGEGIQNVSIFGPGLIWGRGLSRGGGDTVLPDGVGNKSISLKNCHNVTLRDLSILHGGHFGMLATGVDNLTIDNMLIDTNRDGIDIDCCRNVPISNCSVNSPWDDGICLKSSYGLGFARPTDHVTITNGYVTGGYEEGTLLNGTYKPFGPDSKVSRTGRIKFGTESNRTEVSATSRFPIA
jgi:polygalacturonase